MKSITTPAHANYRINPVFLILSYTISALFLFSHSTSVYAQAPETAKIAFVSKRDGNAEIYIMNPDGSQQVNLTQHSAEDYDPAWSPNGKQILFSSNRTEDLFDLYLMNADGTKVRKVFKDNQYRRDPAWSTDGKHIVYAQAAKRKAVLPDGTLLAPTAELTLYMATPNGTSVEKLTKGFDPSWSPDGDEIVYVVTGLDHTPLGVYDVATRTHKVLNPNEFPWTMSPAWSPQGEKITFAKLHGAEFNKQGRLGFWKAAIYIMNSDGTGLQQVTDELVANNPTWSPQGNQLIYNDRAEFLQLYKIDLNGGNPTQLTREGNNIISDWFDPEFALPVSPKPQLLTTQWAEVKKQKLK